MLLYRLFYSGKLVELRIQFGDCYALWVTCFLQYQKVAWNFQLSSNRRCQIGQQFSLFKEFSHTSPLRRRYQVDQVVQGYSMPFQFKCFLINEYIYHFYCILKWQYCQFTMRTDPQQHKKIDKDDRGNPIMTVRTIKYYCYKDNLYQTPELNEKLYLHYKGFKRIENLQNYPNLITIWLSNNCISVMEGLSSLKNMICLYLNNNSISKIEGLDGLDNLSVLHLAHNRIDRVEGLKGLKVLNVLNISENFLNNMDSIDGLAGTTITSIDLSKNQLQNSDELFNFVTKLQNISCLCMKNTPISRVYKNYRKKLIGNLKNLKYLDDRQVKEIDHRLAEAWLKGGPQLETEQKIKILNENEIKSEQQNQRLNEKIARQKEREQQLQFLQNLRKQILQNQPQQQSGAELQQIEDKIERLKSGPKGFQAAITDISIKILHVSQQEQQPIINKYFKQEKMKIQENLKRIKSENISAQDIGIEEDQKFIQAKVRRILGVQTEEVEAKGHFVFNNKWNTKYESLLQAILQKQRYNFEAAAQQLNKTLWQIRKHKFKKAVQFNRQELEYIWTQIQASRFS